jgi:hypothetical protein
VDEFSDGTKIFAPKDNPGTIKREWVGLTDEEKEKLVEAFYGTDIQRLEAIEAKLKEKNCPSAD